MTWNAETKQTLEQVRDQLNQQADALERNAEGTGIRAEHIVAKFRAQAASLTAALDRIEGLEQQEVEKLQRAACSQCDEAYFDGVEAEMRRLEDDPSITRRELRLFMQSPMQCGHAVGELMTCDSPPFGCGGCIRLAALEADAKMMVEENHKLCDMATEQKRRADALSASARTAQAAVEKVREWTQRPLSKDCGRGGPGPLYSAGLASQFKWDQEAVTSLLPPSETPAPDAKE